MQIKSIVLAMLVFLLLPVGSAHALRFGEDRRVHFLQDVSLKSVEGEALYLGYLTKTLFVAAGVYITDGGYVLGVNGDTKKYYPMPTGEELARLQKAGSLPDPLPPYSIDFVDYLFGYSLWIVLAGVIGWTVLGELRKKTAVAENPPAT
jgi:hypothetical protein